MDLNHRQACISAKFKRYFGEVSALKDGGTGYRFGFGFLLLILFPVMLLEIVIVLLAGRDLGLFVPVNPTRPLIFKEEEVPDSLRDLIPLAKKFGVGDDAERGEIMRSASSHELSALEEKVLPRQQEIVDWLDTFPETGISDTASFFLYLGSACDEVSLY
ncbi:MAG: hypothetical protein KZQ97_09255 [Candidatus Thiodiazotropha sp. (ex Dulcina madagascariensis)]|nr:hypothetical protein [Candidatus Thiodiazotropha sp. (ex Dulcina madagascariensis)]